MNIQIWNIFSHCFPLLLPVQLLLESLQNLFSPASHPAALSKSLYRRIKRWSSRIRKRSYTKLALADEQLLQYCYKWLRENKYVHGAGRNLFFKLHARHTSYESTFLEALREGLLKFYLFGKKNYSRSWRRIVWPMIAPECGDDSYFGAKVSCWIAVASKP